MYCDINQVTYNAKKNLVVIEGIDLDTVLLNSWSQEFSEQAEVTFQFDLTQKGQRIYPKHTYIAGNKLSLWNRTVL